MTAHRHALGLCFAVLLGINTQAPVLAQDLENGQKLAEQCSSCHGETGIAADPTVPHIAGQSAVYLESTLIEYGNGTRQNPLMSPIASDLTSEQIRDLAAWFASFELQVTVPTLKKKKFYKAKPPLG